MPEAGVPLRPGTPEFEARRAHIGRFLDTVGATTHQGRRPWRTGQASSGFGAAGGGVGSTGGAAAAAGGGAGGGTVNTAQIDPRLADLYEKYKDRFSKDETKRMVDRSNASIADSAALLGADARAGLAQRGALGSGVHAAFVKKRITDPSLREAARAAADIELGQQQRLDALTLGGLGIARAPGDMALAEKGLALQQHGLEASIANQQAQQALAAQQAQQAQMLALMGAMRGV